MVDILKNNGTFFYELQRKANTNFYDRKPSLANTTLNIPLYQTAENLSRNYARVGQAKYEDPFKFVMRPNNFEYDGRKLQVQETLLRNQEKDFPNVNTKHPLKVTGFY